MSLPGNRGKKSQISHFVKEQMKETPSFQGLDSRKGLSGTEKRLTQKGQKEMETKTDELFHKSARQRSPTQKRNVIEI